MENNEVSEAMKYSTVITKQGTMFDLPRYGHEGRDEQRHDA
jgi:hypothetical protein